ncbi:Ig-like domain-containing protein [Mycobacterium sp. HM-7]
MHPASVVLAPTTTTSHPTGPIGTILGALNSIVTQFTNQFLAPAPNTPEPFTPVVWALLGWVRRDLFNQAPKLKYDPTTTVQTGQTITGNLGATDPEGDKLTYTVTHTPQHGTVTIDQATGKFTYTPNDINYTAAQTDSFTVSVTDGNRINLLNLFRPHAANTTVDLTVLNPTVNRVIMNLPAGMMPNTPRFSGDGQTIFFGATPSTGGRQEIYQINVDGTGLNCMTCGVSPEITAGLSRVVPFQDGSGRLMIQVRTTPNGYAVFESDADGKRLVPVVAPPSAARAVDPLREMRISPDGKQLLFSQIQVGQGGNITAVPIVGTLERTVNATTGAPEYHVANAQVVYPVGEGKQWTPDGKGVIIIGGTYEAGNVDDIAVDLTTGTVSRITANPEYDEDIDMSPNQQWIAVGSTRGYHALSPMDRIERPAFLPAYIQGSVYQAYAGASDAVNVSNQEWAISLEDELKGENGIPLFVNNDGYTARSMASWNADGTAVTFWEANATDSRIVVANLKYTTSVGPVAADRSTPDPAGYSWSHPLATYVPGAAPLPSTGTYNGTSGGTAVVSEAPGAPGHTIRTVTYTNYVNSQGMILNGTESTDSTASQSTIRYVADITVTGTHTGYLTGDVNINKLTRTITSTDPSMPTPITSSLDGDKQVLLDPADVADARANM